MLERLQTDGIAPRATLTSVMNRAYLAVSPAPPSVELRDKAVAPVAVASRSSTEPSPLGSSALAVGRIRDEFDQIAKAESDRKALDIILGKLLPGYKALLDKIESPAAIKDAQDAVATVQAMQSQMADKGASPASEQGGVSSNRDQALAQMETALLFVRELRNKISQDYAGAHDRLLTIGGSAVNSGGGGSQGGGNGDMTQATAAARNLILSNARGVLAAHGRISPVMARMVLG